jgi:hypothetical protein
LGFYCKHPVNSSETPQELRDKSSYDEGINKRKRNADGDE